jgi:FdhD protein
MPDTRIPDSLSARRAVRVRRVSDSRVLDESDVAAVEEPLEVRLHDHPFAVIMRTPGADRELAAGFLLSEGVIANASDLGAVEHCRHPDLVEAHNVVNVFLLGPARDSLQERLADRRHVTANSACGVCGRLTIESLRTRAGRLAETVTISCADALALPAKLRARQPLFEETGALHAAAVFAPSGECAAIAEDVGRHNAVDKAVGQLLLADRLPLTGHALAVSGRASFEIIQKAWMAGIEIVCAISAPSSLAIQLADEAGITLIGFARPTGFNIYAQPQRVRLE